MSHANMISGIDIHGATSIRAEYDCGETCSWLTLRLTSTERGAVRVTVFMPLATAMRLAKAINAAWPEPVTEPAVDWRTMGDDLSELRGLERDGRW